MLDNEMLMVIYTHPNRGQHPVYGSATKTKYGYRKQGDRFLVHKDDVAAQPHLFQVVTVESRPKPRPAAPPPPQPVKLSPAPQPIVKQDKPAVEEKHLQEKQEKIIANARLDIQTLPGVTPAAAAGMRKANLTTVEAILEAGEEGLAKVKFLGAAKAEMIIAYLKERNGQPG